MAKEDHHLVQKGDVWFVHLAVPKVLQAQFKGHRLLAKSLKTIDRLAARRKRNAQLDEWRADFRRRRTTVTADDALTAEAIGWRTRIEREPDPLKRDKLMLDLASRSIDGEESPQEAGFFYDVATHAATALTEHLESWLAESTYTARTKADHRHAVTRLKEWLKSEGFTVTIESVTDKVAARFKATELVAKGANRKTANKLLSGLRTYWKWMIANGHAQDNPWMGKSLSKGRQSMDERERPFSDDEVFSLLNGKADETTRDVMMIGALSGLRLEEIFQLTVADCHDGLFKVRRSKTSARERMVPVHPDLADTVARRCKGKQASDYLIEEGNPTGWDGNRSMAFSKRFRIYRESCHVDDKPEGRRRSRVNFHSWRRWFATKAEQAGHHEHLVNRVLGHKLSGMSFGTYSGGATTEQLRAVVESVKLPVT